MRQLRIDIIPDSLVYKRWIKNAKSEFIYNAMSGSIDCEKTLNLRMGELAADCNQLCELACKSYEDFVQTRGEIVNLLHKLQLQQGLPKKPIVHTGDVQDPLIVKTKGEPTKNMRGQVQEQSIKDEDNNASGTREASYSDKEMKTSDGDIVHATMKTQKAAISEKEVNHKRKEQSESIGVGCYGNYKPLKKAKITHDAEMSVDGTSYGIGGNLNQFLNPYHGMMRMYPQFYSNLRGIGYSQFSHPRVSGSEDRNKRK
ncbi:hypothetical protein PIB30_016329 [Stylosanthes scabra]|uniref:Protein FAR1-RELATED SEQUENCE n=1 Tax=Stylosanthes scabra TaxID=79078 RepID=A0ABU6R7M2_9FABA|nr:hypothetical protein [Stylosanthes scabra]